MAEGAETVKDADCLVRSDIIWETGKIHLRGEGDRPGGGAKWNQPCGAGKRTRRCSSPISRDLPNHADRVIIGPNKK